MAFLLRRKKAIDPLGVVGGYSEAYDLISSEYGWTDDVIGDLTVSRALQIVSAINLRKDDERRRTSALTSWQTRVLSAYIAMGYMIGKDQENLPLDQAHSLAFDRFEQLMLSASPIVPKENAEGSYEKFMSMLGNGGARGI